MLVRQIETRRDFQKFIKLPYHHYRDDPIWVPPLRSEQRNQLDPKRNPLLNHCEYALFLLIAGEGVIGRVAAFIDHLALECWGEPIGLFGYYEAPPTPEGSRLLLETAAGWLREARHAKYARPMDLCFSRMGPGCRGLLSAAGHHGSLQPGGTTLHSLKISVCVRSRTCCATRYRRQMGTPSRSAF